MTTPNPTLPPGHAVEIVRPGSPFLGQNDYSTLRRIEVGNVIVVCRHVPHPAVVTVEAWREQVPNCYNCSAANPGFGLPPPPHAPGYKGVAIPTLVAPAGSLPGQREPEPRRSPFVLLLVIAGLVVLVAAMIFMALGGGGETDPPPTNPATPIVVIVPTEPPPPLPPTDTPTPLPTPEPTQPPPPTQAPEPRRPTATPRPPSPISDLVLYDAEGNSTLLTLGDGGTIDLSQLGTTRLNIVARTTTPVGSVKFLLDGREFCLNGRCVENAPPYSMAGDLDGDYYNNWDWSELVGSHTIQVIPYSGVNAGGEQLPELTVRFTVVP